MFTTNHLDNVLGEIKGYNTERIFSKKKNILAYRLSTMNSQYRGNAAEKMIRDYYINAGYSVKYISGNNPYDMLVNGRKVEVKSALATRKVIQGVEQYRYCFKHICPNNFHKLVMVFISPNDVVARVMNTETVVKYLGTKYTHKDLHLGHNTFGRLLSA